MNSDRLNIAQRLRDNAARWPERNALYYPAPGAGHGSVAYASKTFRQIDDESDAYARGLARLGIGAGTRTILMVKPGPELFSILFALFKVGAVPVVVDPGMGVRRMLHCYAAVGADAFIGIPVAHVVRVLFRRSFRSLKAWVTVGKRRGWTGPTLDQLAERGGAPFPIADTRADDLLMINFTTGSTGPAKGVEYTHRIADGMMRTIQSHFGHGPDEVTLAPLPLFALFDLMIGATSVLPPLDPTRPATADANRMIDAIESFGVTSMFASPAFLHRVGRHARDHGIQLPTIKTVISGGAPVSSSIVDTFRSVLGPDARFHVTYGATEALPIASIESREVAGALPRARAGAGNCVGRPVGDIAVRIVRISDSAIATWSDDLPVPAGEVGEIAISGTIVSTRYHASAESNALMKIVDDDGRIWHRTGDLGAIDSDGRIWFASRKSQRLITPRGPLFTVQCEEIFNGHPAVYRSALVGVGPAGQQEPVLCVELRAETSPDEQRRIEAELRAIAAERPMTRGVKAVLFHPSFPVDIRHNAKIGREQLAMWAAAMLRNREPGARWKNLALRAIPIAGWIFVGVGFVMPLGPVLRPLWAIALFLSAVVHPLQLIVSLPLGRRAGYSTLQTVVNTVVFGATWWKTLLPDGISPRAVMGGFVERSVS